MARVKASGIAVVVAVAVVALIAFYPVWQHWAAVRTGSSNTPGTPPNYNYWSGFGSVFPWEVGFIIGTLTFAYQHGKKTNCHTHGCWRIGSYPVDNYRVCKRCHYRVTGTHPTVEHLQGRHAASFEVADDQHEPGASVASCARCSPGSAGPSAPSA
jgi:hypothetical protein